MYKVLFVASAALGLICCAQDYTGPTFAEMMANPLVRILIAALITAAVESLKNWKFLVDKGLTVDTVVGKLARAGSALLLALGPAVATWADSGNVVDGLHVLEFSWLGAMGLNGLLGIAQNAGK